MKKKGMSIAEVFINEMSFAFVVSVESGNIRGFRFLFLRAYDLG